MDWATLLPELWAATLETLKMVGASTLLAISLGLPLGVLLVITEPSGLRPASSLNQALGAIINVGRSLPFIILMVAIMPLTRAIAGTSIGSTAAIVPLTIAAIPFFARIAEASMREVDRGLIEAAQAMGCTQRQIISKVLIPEALPSLVLGITITIISLIGYSAMAGAIGAGGLGDLAIRYGYHRFNTSVMVATVVLLIAMVQLIQLLGNWLAARMNKR